MLKLPIHKITELEGKISLTEWEKKISEYKETSDTKKHKKWTTLIHNGPVFPKEYKPLPNNIKVKYNGKKVDLDNTDIDNKFNLTAEESSILLLGLVKRFKVDSPSEMPEYAKKNFMKDWKKILGKDHVIKDLNKVDLSMIEEYLEEKKQSKKNMTKEEKKQEIDDKNDVNKLYGYALYDGYKVATKSSIEPPIAFFSSAELKHYNKDNDKDSNYLSGKLKKRILPTDVIINGSSIPECFFKGKPCNWGEVKKDTFIEWFASWRDPVTGDFKYTVIQRSKSILVSSRDQDKFETARELKKKIEKIRKKYMVDLHSNDKNLKLKALATYFLDAFSIRPGGSKKEEQEEGGVGLAELSCGNVILKNKPFIKLDFTGKSGVSYKKNKEVDPYVYDILHKICSKNDCEKLIFPISINDLNSNYLGSMIEGLTAKSFRTWKACTTFENELNKNKITISDQTHDKQFSFNIANIAVGEALNHKAEYEEKDMIKLKNKTEELEQKLENATTEKQTEKAQLALDKHVHKVEQKQSKINTGTSKGNYIDPRITISWAKKTQTPIEKLYTPAIRSKFVWAMDTKSDWKF